MRYTLWTFSSKTKKYEERYFSSREVAKSELDKFISLFKFEGLILHMDSPSEGLVNITTVGNNIILAGVEPRE